MPSKTRRPLQKSVVGTVESRPKLHDLPIIDKDRLTYQDATITCPGHCVQDPLGNKIRLITLPEHEVVALLALLKQVLDSPYVMITDAARRDLPPVRERLQEIAVDQNLLALRGESIIEALSTPDL